LRALVTALFGQAKRIGPIAVMFSVCRTRTYAEDLRDQGGFCEGDFDVKCQDLHAGHR
jgi:hypothetical protein